MIERQLCCSRQFESLHTLLARVALCGLHCGGVCKGQVQASVCFLVLASGGGGCSAGWLSTPYQEALLCCCGWGSEATRSHGDFEGGVVLLYPYDQDCVSLVSYN